MKLKTTPGKQPDTSTITGSKWNADLKYHAVVTSGQEAANVSEPANSSEQEK
jgi:hypothetical protein